jgi:hypothetical protein
MFDGNAASHFYNFRLNSKIRCTRSNPLKSIQHTIPPIVVTISPLTLKGVGVGLDMRDHNNDDEG